MPTATRRDFLKRAAALSAGATALPSIASAVMGAPAENAAPPGKAPFKLLYSNDTTNITTCVSPYHSKGERFTDEMLRQSIDEAAAADVQLLQPGLGWIPWWKSKVYPAEEHYRYYQDAHGIKPNSFGRYMLDGGDIVQTFVDHCRKRRITPFISLRLNDAHHLELADTDDPRRAHTVSKFYREHMREYRIKAAGKRGGDRVFNWAIPEVRAHKFAFIRELCENYDLDGFELDYLRFNSFFRQQETSSDQRREIMTGFVREVRQLLDRTARNGRRRWLCLRIPAIMDSYDELGIDVAAMAAAGADMFNLSCTYFTVQRTDLTKIRALVPQQSLYLEMTHTVLNGPSVSGYDSFPFVRTTVPQFTTTAHLAYNQGADGMSLFNFVYYREHGTEGRGPFQEPPFEVLKLLGDRQELARLPQWYFLSIEPRRGLADEWPLPKTLNAGDTAELLFDAAPNSHAGPAGIVRLRGASNLADCTWRVKLGGTELVPAGPVLKPLDHPYEGYLGNREDYACFACPRELVRRGQNTLAVEVLSGPPATLIYYDVVLP